MSETTREDILNGVEVIQDYCDANNVGLNEERLECREMITDMIMKMQANGDIKDHGKALPIPDVVQLLRKYNGFLSANYHNATYDNSDITEFLSEQ